MVNQIIAWFCLVILFPFNVHSQELFPLNEPASNVPKGVVGVRLFGESFKEINTERNLGALKIMYGLTPKLSVMTTVSTSNHHGKNLPVNLVTHTHVGNQTNYFTQNTAKGIVYPYLFDGVYLFAKYRFYTADGQNKHFRMAVYGEGSTMNVAHDEAEPNLVSDTKGYGAGLIISCLRNRFAASLTTGVIIPGYYQESVDHSDFTGINTLTHTKIQYGRAVKYNLSFGYLVSPKAYTDYSQSNWNVYVEFVGKTYETAKIVQDGVPLKVQTPRLMGGNFIEVYPGIQKIIDSNLRIDFSVGMNLIQKSYVNFYPMYMLGIQRYFYLQKN